MVKHERGHPVRPIELQNDLGDVFIIPTPQIPLCAQCLNPMRVDHYVFTSQRVAHVSFICTHKLSTRYKTVPYRINKKGIAVR